MAEEKLRITITADNKDALAKFHQTIAGLDGISVASGKAGGATKKLGTDFTGMSRVIQDLPYGFNAISNNLTQLVPAAGAAGLAFSGIVTAITFAQIGFGAWSRTMESVDEGMKAATKSVTDFTVNLQNVRNDILAARQGVMSKDEALKSYNDSLGKTIGFASSLDEAEKLMAANTSIVVQSLNLRARAQIMYQNAANESAKLVTGEAYNLSLLEQAGVGVSTMFTGLAGIGSAAGSKLASKYKEVADNAKKLTAEGDKLTKQAINLDKTLAGSRTAPKSGGGGGKAKEVAVKDNSAEEAKKRATFLAHMHGKMLEESMRQDALSLEAPDEKKKKTEKPPELLSTLAIMEAKKRLKTVEDDRNKTLEIANNLTNAAMSGITTLVNAMMQGQNVGQALGDMFKRMAIDIALAAAKAAIFQGILALLPGATTGAALAKEGTGGFFKMFKGLLGFSQGGTVSGPQSGYPVMLHGTEHIVRPDQMKQIIASASQMGGGGASKVIVEGRIQGQDIWLSQQRTNTFRGLTN
jgi:hypothetical protein